MELVKKLIKFVASLIIESLPSTRLFGLKRLLYGLSDVIVESDVKFASRVRVLTNGALTIGRGTWVGHEVMFVGGEAPIELGRDCDVAPRVLFAAGGHEILIGEEKVAGTGYSLPIVIGDGCWICANATVLGGTEIGHCSIVAAGAVVKGSFPPRSLIGGVPARVIKRLEKEAVFTKMEASNNDSNVRE